MIKSPFNYAKTRFNEVEQLMQYFPEDCKRLVEVFSSDGTVSVNCPYKNVLINNSVYYFTDVIKYLIEVGGEYTVTEVKRTIKKYELDTEDGFMNSRRLFNQRKVSEDREVFLIALMAHSYNNQFRFNDRLNYNASYSPTRTFTSGIQENLIKFANELARKNVEIEDKDFLSLFYNLRDTDFIFIDMPRVNSGETRRGLDLWTAEDEESLAEQINFLTRNKYKWMAIVPKKASTPKMNNLIYNANKVDSLSNPDEYFIFGFDIPKEDVKEDVKEEVKEEVKEVEEVIEKPKTTKGRKKNADSSK